MREREVYEHVYWYSADEPRWDGCQIEAWQPTWVYSLFADDGDYLYVGVAEKLARRLNQHSKDKAWFPQVSKVFADLHCCRRHALEEEAWSIATESPVKNVARPAWYRKFDPKWTALGMARFGLVTD